MVHRQRKAPLPVGGVVVHTSSVVTHGGQKVGCNGPQWSKAAEERAASSCADATALREALRIHEVPKVALESRGVGRERASEIKKCGRTAPAAA